MESNSRILAVLGQGFFGFTGLTRIYLGSYLVGFVQFVLFLTALVIFSGASTTPATFIAATALLLLITLIWAVDSIRLAVHCLWVDPSPLWNNKYQWADNRFDMMGGRVLGALLALTVPLYIGMWLFTPNLL